MTSAWLYIHGYIPYIKHSDSGLEGKYHLSSMQTADDDCVQNMAYFKLLDSILTMYQWAINSVRRSAEDNILIYISY